MGRNNRSLQFGVDLGCLLRKAVGLARRAVSREHLYLFGIDGPPLGTLECRTMHYAVQPHIRAFVRCLSFPTGEVICCRMHTVYLFRYVRFATLS